MHINTNRVAFAVALALALPTTALADERRLLDLLLKKHVITQDEYEALLKEVEPPAAAQATAPAAKPDGPAMPSAASAREDGAGALEAQKQANRAKAAADKAAVKDAEEKGFAAALLQGFMPPDAEYEAAPYTPMLQKLHRQERFGLHFHNLEARYAYQPNVQVATGGTHSQFQVATAELEASGYVLPGFLFAQVVVEPRDNLGRGLGDSIAKNIPPGTNAPSGILRDGFLDFVLAEPGATLRVGQQRIPFGIEPQTPGGLLPFTSRSYLDLKLTRNTDADSARFNTAEFVQERDIGVQARGRLSAGMFDYAVGVFNGAGINVSDTNESKDTIARLGFNPDRGLRFGVSGYHGTQIDISKASETRERYGADFEVTQDLIPRFRLMGEFVAGHDGPFARRSWYVQSFYELIPQVSPKHPGLLFGIRYDETKENVTDIGHIDDVFRRWTVGLDYYFLNGVDSVSGYWRQVKFQLDYEFRRHNAATAAFGNADVFNHDLLMGQFTIRY